MMISVGHNTEIATFHTKFGELEVMCYDFKIKMANSTHFFFLVNYLTHSQILSNIIKHSQTLLQNCCGMPLSL